MCRRRSSPSVSKPPARTAWRRCSTAPSPPLYPERTRAKLLLAVLALSLASAAAAGAFLELRDPVIVASDQLGEQFDLPILGGVPAIR